MTPTACTSEPVSWLALERLAVAELDAVATARVRAHLEGCTACAGAFARIVDDARPLPRLPAPAVTPTPPWWRRWTTWSVGAAAVAAVALVLLWPRPAPPSAGVRVKGAGVVLASLVRDRDGAIAFDPRDVRPSDRWKVEVTCATGGQVWIDVAVIQGDAVAFPLPPQPIACGNAVAVPGAFRITDGGAEVCVALAATAPDRARLRAGDRTGTTCRALSATP